MHSTLGHLSPKLLRSVGREFTKEGRGPASSVLNPIPSKNECLPPHFSPCLHVVGVDFRIVFCSRSSFGWWKMVVSCILHTFLSFIGSPGCLLPFHLQRVGLAYMECIHAPYEAIRASVRSARGVVVFVRDTC